MLRICHAQRKRSKRKGTFLVGICNSASALCNRDPFPKFPPRLRERASLRSVFYGKGPLCLQKRGSGLRPIILRLRRGLSGVARINNNNK